MTEEITKEAKKKYIAPVGDSYRVGHSKLLAFTIIISFIVLSLIYFMTGFSVYLIIDLFLWFIFYRYSRYTVIKESFEFVSTIIIFFLVLLFSFMIFGISAPKTFEQVKGNLIIYNNKVLKIKSIHNKLQGSIGLRARFDEKTNKEFLEAYYNILINDSLPSNGYCGSGSGLFGCDKNISYDYVGDLNAVNEESGLAEGGLIPVFCNKTTLPNDPFCEVSTEHSARNCKVLGLNVETDTFLLQFIKRYSSYAELLKSNKIDVYDGSYFWETTEGDDEINLAMNLNKAVRKGWKVASYIFAFED